MPALVDGRLGFVLSPDPTWRLIRSDPRCAMWELDGARLKLTHRAAALLTDPFLLRSFRQVAHCDGDVPRSERRILDSFRSRCGIDPVDAARLEGQAVAEVALPVGANQAERDQLAVSMLAIVTADGVLDPSEQTRTTALANLLGFPTREWLSFLQDGFEA